MKLSIDRRRLFPWLVMTVIVLIVFFSQRYYMNRNRPELVIELPPNARLIKVHDGLIYTEVGDHVQNDPNHVEVKFITRPGSNRKIPVVETQSDSPGGLLGELGTPSQPTNGAISNQAVAVAFKSTLFVTPVNGGNSRKVEAGTLEAADPGTLWKTEAGTIQAFMQQPPHPLATVYGMGASSGGGGTVPPPPKPPFHIETMHPKADPVTLVLRWCSTDSKILKNLREIPVGTVGRDLNATSDVLKYSVAVFDGWVYWVQHAPEAVRFSVSANRQYSFLPSIPHSAVMTVPISGGVPHKLIGGVSEQTELISGTTGVLCVTSNAKVANSQQITLLRTNQPPHKVADTGSRIWGGWANVPPMVLNGCLYWCEAAVNGAGQRLMQAKEDGTEVRVLLQVPSVSMPDSTIEKLTAYRGKLYLRILEQRKLASGGYDFVSTIFWLQLGDKPQLKKMLRGAIGSERESWFDGDYYYFVTTEHREDTTDFSTAGLAGKSVQTLFRYPLPK